MARFFFILDNTESGLSTAFRYTIAGPQTHARIFVKRKKIEPGQRFGRLTCIKKDSIHKKHGTLWACKCSCGQDTKVYATKLLQKRTKTCGCGKFDKGKNSVRWKGCGDISGGTFARIKANARSRNLEFNISIEYIWQLFQQQNGCCAISGLDIVLPERNMDLSTASLDRIDSACGYIPENVHWVHKDINQMKWDKDIFEFVNLCHVVSSYNKD